MEPHQLYFQYCMADFRTGVGRILGLGGATFRVSVRQVKG